MEYWLGIENGVDVPVHVIVEFRERVKVNNELFTNDWFYRFPVIFAQCFVGAEKLFEAGAELIFSNL